MPTSQIDSRRIAKNTAFLYARMLFGMVVSLFTARILLQALGVEDYGLNNVVGGVIGLFSIVTAVLNSATSRFLTVELGKKNEQGVKKIYQNSLSLYVILCFLILLLEETIGLYMINYTLAIPDSRIFACNVLYQTIVFSSILSLIVVPAGSLIIAYEKMDVYAYFGVGEIIARCLLVYLVMVSPFDKLITFSVLSFIVLMIITFWKLQYCMRHFSSVCSNRLDWDKTLVRSMMGFSFWNLIGSAAFILRIQGVSILINIFFGAVVNAANAIAYQINGAVSSFVSNFTTAVNPQITKTCAAQQYNEMKSLIFRSGKFTYYMLMMLCLPILFETNFIIHLWLGDNVPDYTIIMTRLVLLISMVETFTYSIGCAVNATGKVKYYQLVICSIMLLIFPLTWIVFKCGLPPYYGLVIYLLTSIVALFARFYFMKKLLDISPMEYFQKVYLHTLVVSLFSVIVPSLLYVNMPEGWFRFIVLCFIIELSNLMVIWCLGLDKTEKIFVKSLISKVLDR